MNKTVEKLLKSSGLGELKNQSTVQELWAGYGKIQRLELENTSVILKHVDLPEEIAHPKGWNTKLSHQRKIRSYQVENVWYQNFNYLDENARIPQRLASYTEGESFYILMEDLDASGFSRRLENPSMKQIEICIRWLANFHARFLNVEPQGLWKTGSYWHLDTRPDEFEKIENRRTKWTAGLIDQKLATTSYKTLIHGDAKLANFCFSQKLDLTAAVDFQYVGGGCGMVDLAYFVSSCMNSQDCFKFENKILEAYFTELKKALGDFNDFDKLEKEWRELYPVAWADFYRFLAGWSPEHWKVHAYSEQTARSVQTKLLDELTEIGKSAALKAGETISSYGEVKIERKDGPAWCS